MKQKLCSFRYGREKPKADSTYTEKIALARTIFSAHYLQGLLSALTARQPHLHSVTVRQTSGSLVIDD